MTTDITPPTREDYLAMETLYDTKRECVKVDKHAVDDELCAQAQHFLEVCEGLTMALSYQAAAKDYFDQVEAEIDTMVRNDWPQQGPEKDAPKVLKMTEAGVKALVMVEPDWRAAKDIRRRWDMMVIQFQGLKETFHGRNFMVRALGELFTAGYYTPQSAGERPPMAPRRARPEPTNRQLASQVSEATGRKRAVA